MSNFDEYFEEAFEIEEELLRTYHEVSERKKVDEKWLKENGKHIKEIMEKLNKDKKDVGNYRISVSIPNTSKFDNEKVLEFLIENLSSEDLEKATKLEVDEEGLAYLVEDGVIDLDELKEYAWVESTGAPRLSVKVKKKGD